MHLKCRKNSSEKLISFNPNLLEVTMMFLLLEEDILIFWGLWFFFVIKLFSTPSLNVTLLALNVFQNLSKAKFFSQQSNTKQFFYHLFHLFSAEHFMFLSCHHILSVSTVIFDKASYCVEYVEQNC